MSAATQARLGRALSYWRIAVLAVLAMTIMHGAPSLTPAAAAGTVINGSDYAGADFTPANGDCLDGTFTNIGTFTISAGTTVFVNPGTVLSISATSIVIDGTLDGTGAGFVGGVAQPVGSGGVSGNGPGAGGGGGYGNCCHGTGGGGGAYGGAGGNGGRVLSSPAVGVGGATYGTTSTADVQMGSGGGSASSRSDTIGGRGGAGGGGIDLVACDVQVNGNILAVGEAGQLGATNSNSGGGGGSGGTIQICANSGLIAAGATLSCAGGIGVGGTAVSWPGAGGGGGGGRVKLASTITMNGTTNIAGAATTGGSPNTSLPAQPGATGTFDFAITGCPTIACDLTITCPADQDVECGVSETLSFDVEDLNGEAMTVTFTVDGTAVPAGTANVAAGAAPNQATVDFAHVYAGPSGTIRTVEATVTNTSGASISCSMDVTVVDTTPPVVTAAVVRPMLLPLYSGLCVVGAGATITDICDGTITDYSVTVYSDEANGAGAPYLTPDAIGTTLATLRVRSERLLTPAGNGRYYLIAVTASDGAGNTATGCATVIVPKFMTAMSILAVQAEAAAAKAAFEAGTPPANVITTFLVPPANNN